MQRSRVAFAAIRALPKRSLSRAAGRAAGLPLPAVLRRSVLGAFGNWAGVDWGEVRDPIESFGSLQAFFTRALIDGARPIDPAPDAVVSPCDGAWGAAGQVRDGLLLQIKGRPYSLASLLGDEAAARRFEGGDFATFYLAPRDYHRFHACCAARVTAARHIPGELWPVNRLGVENVEGLFAENERICAFMRVAVGAALGSATATGEGASAASEGGANLCMVAVGATNVGKIRLTFDDLSSNIPGATGETREYSAGTREVVLAKGEEWGRFEFGSTIVMLAEPGVLSLDLQPPGTRLRMGRRIGRLGGA